MDNIKKASPAGNTILNTIPQTRLMTRMQRRTTLFALFRANPHPKWFSARNLRDMRGLKRKQRRGLCRKIGQNVLSHGKERKQGDAITR